MNYEIAEKRERRRNAVLKTVVYILLAVWALIVLFPFYWMILTSVKDSGAYNFEQTPVFFTLSPTLENYAKVFSTDCVSWAAAREIFF